MMVRRAVAVVASAAVVLATGVAWATLRDLTQGITTSSALSGTHAVAPSEDGSVNVLLMGLDSRKDLFDADNRHPEAAEAVGAGALATPSSRPARSAVPPGPRTLPTPSTV